MTWVNRGAQAENPERELSDGALETRLRLLAHHLQALSRKRLIDAVVAERRQRVMDRRCFLTMLMQHDVAIHAMPPEEWGSDMSGAEPDPLDEDELTVLLGRAPTAQEIEDYLLHLDAVANGPEPEDLVEWAMQMPDR